MDELNVNTGSAWRDYSVDLGECGAGTQNVALINNTANASPVGLRSVSVCEGSRCQDVFADEAGLIRTALVQASDWGRAQGVPVYLGEFGAYSTGDMASRARWTATVQAAAEAEGLSSAYWEFASGFGAYDLDADGWRSPLLQALQR